MKRISPDRIVYEAIEKVGEVNMHLDEKRMMVFNAYKPTLRDVRRHNHDPLWCILDGEGSAFTAVVQAKSRKQAESKARQYMMSWLGRKAAYARNIIVHELGHIL